MADHYYSSYESTIDDKYSIIYVFVPLRDVETYMSDKPVSFCKIGMTTSPFLSYKDINESIIKRGKSTGYPYEMKAVDFLVFEKTSLKIDNIFRTVVYEIGKSDSSEVRVSVDINSSEELVVSPGREFVYNCRKSYVDISKKLVQYVISGKKDIVYEKILDSCSDRSLYNLDQFRDSKYYIVSSDEENESSVVIGGEKKNNTENEIISSFRLKDYCCVADYVYLNSDRVYRNLGKNNELHRMLDKIIADEHRQIIGDALYNIGNGIEKYGAEYIGSRNYDSEYDRIDSVVKDIPICNEVQGMKFSELIKLDIPNDEVKYRGNLKECLKFQLIGNSCLIDDYNDYDYIALLYMLKIVYIVKRDKSEFRVWSSMNGNMAKYNDLYKYMTIEKIVDIVNEVKYELGTAAINPVIINISSEDEIVDKMPVEIDWDKVSGKKCDINHFSEEDWSEIIEITREVIGRDDVSAADIMEVFREDIADKEKNGNRNEFLSIR